MDIVIHTAVTKQILVYHKSHQIPAKKTNKSHVDNLWFVKSLFTEHRYIELFVHSTTNAGGGGGGYGGMVGGQGGHGPMGGHGGGHMGGHGGHMGGHGPMGGGHAPPMGMGSMGGEYGPPYTNESGYGE